MSTMDSSNDKAMAALFAQMVMQNTNMALIFLGQAPNPQTGQTSQDLEHARYFIDQLEMLELKTKGNLSAPESNILQQSLTSLRLAFVEAVNKQPKTAPAAQPSGGSSPSPAVDEQETPINEPTLPGEASAPPPNEAGSTKRFTKKY